MGCELVKFAQVYSHLSAHLQIGLPFLLSLWMAWSDVRTHRIPNYLTLGCALAGLGYQLGYHSWAGVADGLLGMVLGLALLIFFYLRGGMGAGDVKALAALGAWLGPWQTFHLFVYMAISGGILAIILLWWRGLLWGKMRQGWRALVNLVLLRPYPSIPQVAPSPATPKERMPYAVALAVGMAILCFLPAS